MQRFTSQKMKILTFSTRRQNSLNGVLDETTTANTRGRSSRAHAWCCKFTSGSRPSSSRRPILRSLLAIVVRNDENIKGIKISDSETKLLQFADDKTAISADLNSAQALLKLLNDFEKVSGLKLNVMKTEAMWIGSLQNCEDEPLGFKWKTCQIFGHLHYI